jgi:hypothetical protein
MVGQQPNSRGRGEHKSASGSIEALRLVDLRRWGAALAVCSAADQAESKRDASNDPLDAPQRRGDPHRTLGNPRQ